MSSFYSLTFRKYIISKGTIVLMGHFDIIILSSLIFSNCIILGRNKVKNQNDVIIVTVRLQSFGTRLKVADLIHLMG